ncbi:MAG: homocitrate synthase [Deltaproteobacteria bacterium]|jgi:homocitrate synthase NifV|nr:homocitrate synthase [Deltaproteobacteria bacterium]
MRPVKLVDATLRDGEQAPGLAFSPEVRAQLAVAMDAAGIFQLEVGCPAMGPAEVDNVKAIKKVCSRALISAWNRIRPSDVEASLSSGADLIHLAWPTTKLHLERKIQKTWAKAAEDLATCLKLAKGQAQVSVGLEDVSRATPEELSRAAELLLSLEVKSVRLSDTVGILTPTQARSLVRFFLNKGFLVEFHAHNDLGLAVANTLAAALAGAEKVDVTLLGVGERAGNCALARLVDLTSHKLDLGLTLQKAQELEDLARPYLDRAFYARNLLASKAPDIEGFFYKLA